MEIYKSCILFLLINIKLTDQNQDVVYKDLKKNNYISKVTNLVLNYSRSLYNSKSQIEEDISLQKIFENILDLINDTKATENDYKNSNSGKEITTEKIYTSQTLATTTDHVETATIVESISSGNIDLIKGEKDLERTTERLRTTEITRVKPDLNKGPDGTEYTKNDKDSTTQKGYNSQTLATTTERLEPITTKKHRTVDNIFLENTHAAKNDENIKTGYIQMTKNYEDITTGNLLISHTLTLKNARTYINNGGFQSINDTNITKSDKYLNEKKFIFERLELLENSRYDNKLKIVTSENQTSDDWNNAEQLENKLKVVRKEEDEKKYIDTEKKMPNPELQEFAKVKNVEILQFELYSENVGYFGNPLNVFLAVSTFPNITFRTFVMTESKNYLIINIPVTSPNNYRDWKKSYKFDVILDKNYIEINNSTLKTAYYQDAKATFWELGELTLVAIAEQYSDENSNFYETERIEIGRREKTIWIRGQYRSYCYPILQVRNCQSADVPVYLYYGDTASYFATIEEPCGNTDIGPFSWDLYDWTGKKHIKHLQTSKNYVYNVGRREITINVNRLHMQIFMLRLSAVIGNIRAYARCYIRLLPGILQADLVGGNYRSVARNRPFLIVANQSRDMSLPLTMQEHTMCTITCKSETDPDNKFCKALNTANNVVHVPAFALKRNATYNFTVTVYSVIDKYVKDMTFQLIKVRDDKPLKEKPDIVPHIICVKNCFYDFYNSIEELQLSSKIFYCPEDNPERIWFLDDTEVGDERHLTIVNTNMQKDIIIRLDVKCNGQKASTTMSLKYDKGPTGGSCTIDPASGIEAITDFKITCKGYRAVALPIDYRLVSVMADNTNVLVDGYIWSSELMLRLPRTEKLIIKICDYIKACTSVELKVNIQETKIKPGMKALQEFLKDSTDVTNLPNLLLRGKWQQAFIVGLTAVRNAKTTNEMNYIFSHFKDYILNSLVQFEQFYKLSIFVANALYPLDHSDANSISRYLEKSTIIFEAILNHEDLLHPDGYVQILEETIDHIHILSIRSEIFPVAHCRHLDFECSHTEKLIGGEMKLVKLNDDIAYSITCWLWYNAHLYDFIFFLGRKGTQRHSTMDTAVISDRGQGIMLYIKSYYILDVKENLIRTPDSLFEIFFSEPLMKELYNKLNTQRVLLQIISQNQKRNNFWWFPEAGHPDTAILVVNPYSKQMSNEMRAIQLESPLQFNANITPDSSSDHYQNSSILTSGTLTHTLQMHTHKISLDANAALSVLFFSLSGPVMVLLQVNEAPTGDSVMETGCAVEEATRKQRLVLQNACADDCTAYISIRALTESPRTERSKNSRIFKSDHQEQVPMAEKSSTLVNNEILKPPVNYSFLLEVYKCSQWDPDLQPDPGWTSQNCETIYDTDGGNIMRCKCKALGIFSARMFPAMAKDFIDTTFIPRERTNLFMLFLFLLLLLLLFIVMFTFSYGLNAHKSNSILSCGETVGEDIKTAKGDDMVVAVTTGGQILAGTSSNVSIYFHKKGLEPIVFHINQDPEHPRLTCNSTCSVNLNTGDLRLPLDVAIELKPQGRYPSWYCRRIEVIDLKHGERQLFIIEKWFYTGRSPFYRSKYFSTLSHQAEPFSWCQRFCLHLERIFINWFLFQPLLGPWQYGTNTMSMNRFERSCCWLAKLSTTFAICAMSVAHKQLTTESSFEDEHVTTRMKPQTTIGLCLVCYLVTILIDTFYQIILLRWVLKRY